MKLKARSSSSKDGSDDFALLITAAAPAELGHRKPPNKHDTKQKDTRVRHNAESGHVAHRMVATGYGVEAEEINVTRVGVTGMVGGA